MNAEQKIPNYHLLLLTIGFGSIAVAITSAYLTPATGYELSIYSRTPVIFWIGITLALLLSVAISFLSLNSRTRAISRGLGAFSIILIVLLPIIRNYYYVGEGDALSHLGIALDIKAGAVSVTEQLYPLSHVLSIILSSITGLEVRRTLVLLLAVFITAFILFVPLTSRLFSNDEWTVNVAIFSALLLLPINHFTGHMHPHTSSYAMFFIPFAIYPLVLLIKSYNRNYVILIVASLSGMVLLHPQHAANIIILFGTGAILQVSVGHLLNDSQPTFNNRKIYPYVSMMLVIFWFWTEGLDKVSGNIRKPLANFLARSQREPGGNVRDAAPSLEAAGGSPEEIFIKLFLIAIIYCAFAAILMGSSLTELFKNRSNRIYKYSERIAFSNSSSNLLVIYLTFGFIAIIGLFFVYVLANQSIQYFRHQSFMMGIVTILGASSLAEILKIAYRDIPQRIVLTGVCILFITFLLLSVPVIHVSPYLYQESEQVPESQVKGFETAFDHKQDGIPFTAIRSLPFRYRDAIIGERKETSYIGGGTVPFHYSEEGDLYTHYEEETYLVVTSRDRTRDRELHRGIRYTREDYEHFDNGKGIDRIQDNGGFTLYKITPDLQ